MSDNAPLHENVPTEEDRAEFDRITQELADDTYRLIGQCITIWSKGEGLLVDIAAVLLGTESEKAGLVLYSINNFHTWLSIIEELFTLDPRYAPLKPDWIKISERLKKCNNTRVALAHHALGPGKGIEHFVETDFDDISAIYPTLRPNRSDMRAKSRKHTALGMEELSVFIDEMGLALVKIDELFDRMIPIFLERQQQLSNQIKRVKEKVREMNIHRAAIRTDYGG
jgi:hypothetical protein